MKKLSLVILIMLSLIVIVGCTTTASNVEQKHCIIMWEDIYWGVGEISKIEIPEDNITCYIFEQYGDEGGISCMRNEVK